MSARVPPAWLRPNLVDRLMLRLEGIQGPLTFHVFLDLDGDLDRQALQAALRTTLADCPVLASRTVATSLGHRRKPLDPAAVDVAALVTWAPGAGLEAEHAFVDAPIALEAGPPVRLLVRPHGGGTRLVAQVHHSAMDGVGTFLWLDQLARRYGEHLAGLPASPPPPVAASRSYRQYVLGLSWRDRWAVVSRGADAVAGFFFGQGTGTGGPNADYATFLDAPPPGRGPVRWETASLAPGEVAALKAWARARGATMNDVLFAAFAAAGLARFPQDRPVVAHVPVNLREGEPAGSFNRVADVRIALDPAQLQGFEAALAATVAVTPAARDRLQAIARVFERFLASYFPPRLFRRLVVPYMDRPKNGIMTFDFSNLGDLRAWPGDFGAARVTAGFLVGPQSVPPGLGCYVTTIRGQLTLSLGYVAPALAPESARALLAATHATLLGLVGAGEVAAPR